MPRNGEINIKFGVYKNLCCGAEIVIPANVTLPACAVHFNLPTTWQPVAASHDAPHADKLDPRKKRSA